MKSIVVAATLLSIAQASAEPTITVGPSVPFSARELAEAVRLRVDSNAHIHVSRAGDSIVITADGTTRPVTVTPETDDPHEAARIAALVIVALSEPASTPVTVRPAASPIASSAPAASSDRDEMRARASATLVGTTSIPGTWSIRAGLGMRAGRAKVAGLSAAPVAHETATASLLVTRQMGSNSRLVLGMGWDRATPFANRADAPAMQASSAVLSARAGVELSHRWFAIEGGVAAAPFHDCGDKSASSWGPYVSSRIHLVSVANKHRIFGEVGAAQQRMTVTEAACSANADGADTWPFLLTHTSVHATLGMEVSL